MDLNCSHVSLSLFQVGRLESAQWYHPSSARQPHNGASAVRSESHRPPLTRCIICDMTLFYIYFCNLWIWCIFNCAHGVIVALSGPLTRISSVAPSHLSSATSRCCKWCTLRIASPSIDTVIISDSTAYQNLWFKHIREDIFCLRWPFPFIGCISLALHVATSNWPFD